MKQVYLDNAATTPIDKEVLAEMGRVYEQFYGNPSSIHTLGQEARKVVEESRRTLAKIIHARSDEIIFTASGSESDNLAIKGVALKNRKRGKHIISTPIEHSAVRITLDYLERRRGFEVTYLPVDRFGLVKPIDLEEAIRYDTTLVSIMYANNEIGTIEPIAELGRICRAHDVFFHSDAVQAFCKVPIDVQTDNIDLLSAAAHKINGPKGVGFLYVRNGGTKPKWGKYIEPLIHGGGHEYGLRAGTENTPGIAGFAKAATLLNEKLESEKDRQTLLRDKIIRWILEHIENSFLNGHPTQRLSNNVNISFKYVEGESMLLGLNEKGIAVSTGSACSSTSLEPSHVLTAIGVTPELAHGSLRVTLGKFSTEAEVDYFLENLKSVIDHLRAISPHKKGQQPEVYVDHCK
jgi:cysteine desulfurase